MSIIRADSIKNRAGNGAPDFPNGLTVTGVVTSTTLNANVTGDLSVTGNLGVGGTITYEDVTNVDSVGVITARSGIKIGPTAGVAATIFSDGSINTSGIVTAINVSAASSVTATTFHGSGANLTGISAGKVLQVVQGTKTDTFNTTSSSDVEVTGLSVAITPSSSSNKVLLSIHLGMVGGDTNGYAGFTLYREIGGSSTDLLIGDSGGGNRPSRTFAVNTNSNGTYSATAGSFQLLDSPNTTSAITYKIKVRSGYTNKNIYINRMHSNDNENYTFRTASTYIAQEIEA